MIVKFKKLHPEAVIPSYAKPGDAGLDLTAASVDLVADERDVSYIEYGTGLAVEIPRGYVGFVFPRSSISGKDQILTNSVGVIDSGYRGEIKARFKPDVFAYTSQQDGFDLKLYQPGERILQLVILPYPTIEPTETEELSDTERGAGGYGSTGK